MKKLLDDRATITAGLLLLFAAMASVFFAFYADPPPNMSTPKCEAAEIPLMNTDGWWCVPARRVR